MQLVPMEMRAAAVPCRHIPLNQKDETIHSLYRCGTPDELEAALSEWLMTMIQKLEFERTRRQFDGNDVTPKKSA